MKRTLIPDTPFGPVVILWSGNDGSPKVTRVLLSRPGVSAPDEVSRLSPDAAESSCPEIDSLAADIRIFLAGRDVTSPSTSLTGPGAPLSRSLFSGQSTGSPGGRSAPTGSSPGTWAKWEEPGRSATPLPGTPSP